MELQLSPEMVSSILKMSSKIIDWKSADTMSNSLGVVASLTMSLIQGCVVIGRPVLIHFGDWRWNVALVGGLSSFVDLSASLSGLQRRRRMRRSVQILSYGSLEAFWTVFGHLYNYLSAKLRSKFCPANSAANCHPWLANTSPPKICGHK